MKKVIMIAIVAGVAVSAVTGLSYMFTIGDNPFETQETNWEGIYGPIYDADEWDIEFYKNWCVSNNGVWFESNECKWKHRQDHYDAMNNLKLSETVVISGKFANQICDTMDITCPENTTFDGTQDVKTSTIRYEGYNLGNIYRFKIVDDQLYYIQEDAYDKKLPSDQDWILVKET